MDTPIIYETSPEGIIINSKLLAINVKLLKRVLIASFFNGFSINSNKPINSDLCTQMAIGFSVEKKIESKNYSIEIFTYSKIEKKKFNTNLLINLHFFHSYCKKIKYEIPF